MLISRLPTTLLTEWALPAIRLCSWRKAVGVPGVALGLLKAAPPLWKCSPAIWPPSWALSGTAVLLLSAFKYELRPRGVRPATLSKV